MLHPLYQSQCTNIFNIGMVACLEWWNSHFIIRCSFETGNWTQIPQAFPTLWRMLMLRIQHLRTRLPVHIGFVPVKKPGEETKEKNHQSTTQANTKVVNRCSSASAQQCSNIFGWKAHVIPTSFGNVRFFSAICHFGLWTLRFGSPSFTTVKHTPTQNFKPRELHFLPTYQLMTSIVTIVHVTSKFAT